MKHLLIPHNIRKYLSYSPYVQLLEIKPMRFHCFMQIYDYRMKNKEISLYTSISKILLQISSTEKL